ncbi:MAG: Rrf2 family transcriptional regulator [Chitinophagaceae bacterium]
MNNTRFATSIHILTLLAMYPDELLSSEFIASSININPVLVRKEIIQLRKKGWIDSKEGKGGGNSLALPAKEILLSDIYLLVRQSAVLGRSNDPNPKCKVGRQINKHIDNLYEEAEEALIRKLAKTSVADFVKQFS